MLKIALRRQPVNDSIIFPHKEEHSVNLENVTIRMLTYPIRTKKEFAPSRFTLHTHTHAELFVCTEGSFHLQTANAMLTVGAGDLVIVPPDFPHHKLPSPEGTVWYCLDFTCVGRRRANCNDLMKPLSLLCSTKYLLLARGVPELCEEISKAANYKAEELPCLPAMRLATVLTELCGKEVQRLGREDMLTPAAPVPAEETTDINRLSQLDYLINACFSNASLSVSHAAALLFISERQLERIMKKEYGKPFRRTLCDRRLDAAEQMLYETELATEQIGSTVGFSSRAAFDRAFVQRRGITPSEYRAQKYEKPQD